MSTKIIWSATINFIATTDKQQLFAKRWKNSNQPKKQLVFVHGLAGDHSAYQALIEKLLATIPDLSCIAFDLRGHGQSSYVFSDSATTLAQQYAQDLATICEFYNIDQPIFIGQSFGGMIIQSYLETQRAPCPSKIILISAGLAMPAFGLSPTWCYKQLVAVSQRHAWKTRTRTWAKHQRHQGSWDYSPRRIATDIYFTQPSKYFLIWLAAFGWRAQQPPACNQATTYYVYGNRDVVIPPFLQRRFLRQLSNVKPIKINSNHNAIVNHPEILAKEIKKIFT